VNPFEGRPAEEMSPNEILLNDIFDHGGWRIDCGRPLACVHSEKILASLQELKDRSPYVTVVHEPTGITALHAAAINGFEDIFRALVENGGMDPLAPALPLKFAASSKTEYVKGPDCIWIGRRRNHKALVKYMSGLPAVASELKELAIELEKQVKEKKS
jgi:ankyrin repeat protein